MDQCSTIRWLWDFHAWARPRVLGAAAALSAEQLGMPESVPGGLGTGSLHDLLAHVEVPRRFGYAVGRVKAELRCPEERTSPT
jgi:uncharacterized damage-inducible protein DinB